MPRLPAAALFFLTSFALAGSAAAQPISGVDCPAPTVVMDPVRALVRDVGEITDAAALRDIDSFNAFVAARLLSEQSGVDERLHALGVPAAPPLGERFSIRIDRECLSDSLFRSLSRKERRKLLDQAISTASFLADAHVDLRGNGTPPFNFVRLCAKSVGAFNGALGRNDPTLSYEGTSLRVTMGRSWYGLDPFGAQELRAAWHSGNHLGFSDARLKLLWKVAGDPLGVVRTSVRREVGDAASRIARRKAAADAARGEALRSEALGLIELANARYLRDGGTRPLVDEARERVRTLDEPGLRAFIDGFTRAAADPDRQNEVADTITNVATNSSIDLDLDQRGFVNVGNLHAIDVNVFGTAGGPMGGYVTTVERTRKIKVTQRGFVNVYTVDDVNVSVTVAGTARGVSAANRPLETSALETALRGLP